MQGLWYPDLPGRSSWVSLPGFGDGVWIGFFDTHLWRSLYRKQPGHGPLCPSPSLSRLPLPHSRAGSVTHPHAGTASPTAPASPGLPSNRAAVHLLPHTLQCSYSYGAISPQWALVAPTSFSPLPLTQLPISYIQQPSGAHGTLWTAFSPS